MTSPRRNDLAIAISAVLILAGALAFVRLEMPRAMWPYRLLFGGFVWACGMALLLVAMAVGKIAGVRHEAALVLITGGAISLLLVLGGVRLAH